MAYSLVASLVIAGVETALSASAQSSAASAQNKATSEYTMAQSKAVIDNAISQYGQGAQQVVYHDAQARQKQQQEDLAANAAAAQAATNAAGRGVTGNSVDEIQYDYENRKDSYNADVEYNRRASDNEIMAQLEGIHNQSQGELNQVRSNYLQPGPSIGSALTQFVGVAASTYGAAGGFNSPSKTYSPAPDPWSGLEITPSATNGPYGF